MTKKIQCRVIDSTPLSPDEQIHLGWSFDTCIYKQDDSSGATYNSQPAAGNKSRSTNMGKTIDCYA